MLITFVSNNFSGPIKLGYELVAALLEAEHGGIPRTLTFKPRHAEGQQLIKAEWIPADWDGAGWIMTVSDFETGKVHTGNRLPIFLGACL